MADFSFLRQRLDPTLRTAEYTVREVNCDPPMKLTVRFAGEANTAYRDAMSELAIAEAEDSPARPARTPQEKHRQIVEIARQAGARQRSRDRRVYPEHVLVSWTGVPGRDKEGALVQVPFSIEDARALLDEKTGLPDVVFDRLRGFCMEPLNFMDVTPLEAGHPGVESTAKNL